MRLLRLLDMLLILLPPVAGVCDDELATCPCPATLATKLDPEQDIDQAHLDYQLNVRTTACNTYAINRTHPQTQHPRATSAMCIFGD